MVEKLGTSPKPVLEYTTLCQKKHGTAHNPCYSTPVVVPAMDWPGQVVLFAAKCGV